MLWILTCISIALYLVIVLGATLGHESIKINDMEWKSPVGRFLFALIAVPAIGLALFIGGAVSSTVGKFLLLPFMALFELVSGW
jgi:hypothetical protein